MNTGRQGEDRAQSRGTDRQADKRDMAGDNMTQEDIRGVYVKRQTYVKMVGEDGEDSESDSELVIEFSPGRSEEKIVNDSTGAIGASTKETPIEKEIRKAIQREQSLRRSRGLPNLPSTPEYVELNLRKNVLSKSVATKSERFHVKDRQFAGKKMQQDIYEEARREEDLVKIGKVPGFYDKGTERQLKEKKYVFEAFQQPDDSTSSSALSMRRKTFSSSDILTLEDQKDVKKPSTLHRRSVDLLDFTDGHTLVRSSPSGGGLVETLLSRSISTKDNGPTQQSGYFQQEVRRSETSTTNERLNARPSGTGSHGGVTRLLQQNGHGRMEEEVTKKTPFFKLRPSSSIVQQDIHESQEREKELRKQRVSLYGGGAGEDLVEDSVPSMSASHRFVYAELAESGFETDPSTGHQSPGKLIMWPPPSVQEQRTSQPGRPWTSRRKNPLVQRWESGQFYGHQEDEE